MPTTYNKLVAKMFSLMYKLKRYLFFKLYRTWFSELRYSKFFDEVWERELID